MRSDSHKEKPYTHSQLADYARFPDMNPGPVCRLDLNGRVVLANKAARELFRDRDVIGADWMNICSDFTYEMWKDVLNAKESLSFEANIEERFLMFNYVITQERDSVFIFGTDITDRKIAEKLLTEIARFPDMNPAPVLRFDFEGNILLANEAAHNVFGIDLEGQCWRDICPGLENDKIWKSVQEAVDEPYYIETHIDRKEFMFAHRSDSENRIIFAFGADITQNKIAERLLRQSDKMATLGTLAAGITHELNNPAAAISRASEQLREIFSDLEQLHLKLNKVEFSDVQDKTLNIVEQQARKYTLQPIQLDVITRSEKEIEIENWLNTQNIDNAWDLAPLLTEQEYDIETLNRYYDLFGADIFSTVLNWSVCVYNSYNLLGEITQSSSRISEIINAVKHYSYMDKAPVQLINIHEGIDDTLIILGSKLKSGINIIRKYSKDIPPISAYGGELNQVWTNIISNASDAMNGKGQIIIRTKMDKSQIIVEFEDNGPGIPREIQSRIFDPFFTTKQPGKGTGMGLSTSYSIVCNRHKGKISVISHPGKTCFAVNLPLKSH